MKITRSLYRLAIGVSGAFATIAGARLVAGGMRRHRNGEPARRVWTEIAAGSALVVAGLMAIFGLARHSET